MALATPLRDDHSPQRAETARFGGIFLVAFRYRTVPFVDRTGLHFPAFKRGCCMEAKIVSVLATCLGSRKPPQHGYEDLEPDHAQTSRYLHSYFTER